jgi:hypothetical protein
MPWNSSIVNSEILAVHAALVPMGRQGEVVLFGGDEHWWEQQESAGGGKWKKTRVYDVAEHRILTGQVQSPDSDVFCSHHAFTADGRLLIVGGTSEWPDDADHHKHDLSFLGHDRCWVYNSRARRWTEVSRLNRNPDQPHEPNTGGRWYPGCVTLGSGDVFTCFGHLRKGDVRHRNTLPEFYNLASNTWVNGQKPMAEPDEPTADVPIEPKSGTRYLMFARVFTLPDGHLFFATPMPAQFTPGGDGTYFSTLYNPAKGEYVGHKIPEPAPGYRGWSRPAVMLPLLPSEGYRARVLFCGDLEPVKIDLGESTPEWVRTKPRTGTVAGLTRKHSNAVNLPTGQVCLIGGVHLANPEQGVSKAEIYTPAIDWNTGTYSLPDDRWETDESNSAARTRNYHSTALLLPNGKVWVAGGNINEQSGNPKDVGVRSIELYEPPYIAVPNRISIQAAPPFTAYGSSFSIDVDRPATSVQRVALIRSGSATHATNNDQRYVGVAIESRSGNTLTLSAPPNGNVAPPGYYMLWVVDTSGNPCREAKFVRLGHTTCNAFTDRSTFSEEEILSLGQGGTATIRNAVYLNFDGFFDWELAGAPSASLSWADSGDPIPASQMTLVPSGRLLERNPPDPDIPQRITFPFHVRFPDTTAWGGISADRRVTVTFRHGLLACSATFKLTKAPNPYMTDIDPLENNPGWLSTDVRVLMIPELQTRFGIRHGPREDLEAGPKFIREVLDRFNSAPDDSGHPFMSISPKPEESPLSLPTSMATLTMYNYVVAKVRYRAMTTVAQRVKVFFRLFHTLGTSMEYDPGTTYRRSGPGPNTVPLLGKAGDELVSIPFFAGKRVETREGHPGATSMANQPLDPQHEVRDIAPSAGGEVTMYFGAWLDFNRTDRRFPLHPGAGDGPWPAGACVSIQELMRGPHQCLVAEVYFEPDETELGKTPATSDNLSQRNVTVIRSDNPGGPDSHVAMHTFDIKPSSIGKLPPGTLVEAVSPGEGLAGAPKRWHPDELFFRWYDLPAETEITLYFSDIDTAEIMQLAATRLSPGAFTAVDNHTITFRAGDAASMPLPGGREENIPALLSVRLPDTVLTGQTYRLSVHQVDGSMRQVVGACEMTIPVSDATLMVDEERRNLSVLKHIFTKIPTTDHWHPIFLRYLKALGKKVDDLGGDSEAVHPNPDGSGEPYVPPPQRPPGGSLRRCLQAWLVSLVLAVALVLLGVVESSAAHAVIAVVAIVALALLVRSWAVRCCGRIRCALLDHVLLGAAAAAGVLGVLLVSDFDPFFLDEATAIAAVIAALAALGSFVLRCRGECCDDEHPCGG